MTVHLDPTRNAAPGSGKSDARATALSAAREHFQAFADYAHSGGSLQRMKDTYAPEVHFHDPLFGNITQRDDLIQMWQLCGAGATNNHVTPGEPTVIGEANGITTVQVPWHADYFIRGNHVLNDSVTTLEINADGKIVSQQDDWDLQKWVNQALPATRQVPARLQPAVCGAVAAAASAALKAVDTGREAEHLFSRLAKAAQDAVGWQTPL